jgi:acetyl-CoA carboxylase carboxyl transferase subunit beta
MWRFDLYQSAFEWQGLFDTDSFIQEDGEIAPLDPLNFVSPKDNYAQKLRDSQQETGLYDAMISGAATLMGQPLQVTISEFEFIGGSMGSVFGEKIARAAERAYERRVPLLTINASGGARMHEGVLSLMQLPKVNLALARLGSIGMPHISLMMLWRCIGIICLGRRYHHCRARGPYRLCWPSRH